VNAAAANATTAVWLRELRWIKVHSSKKTKKKKRLLITGGRFYLKRLLYF